MELKLSQFLLIPYFSWKVTHHAHHVIYIHLLKLVSLTTRQKATASMERDENYVPYTRSKYNLPKKQTAMKADYREVFEETPLATVYRLFIQQSLYVASESPDKKNANATIVVGGYTSGGVISLSTRSKLHLFPLKKA